MIVGAGETAEIAYEYFTFDSPFEVVGFSVPKRFLDRASLFELPITALEDLENDCDPTSHQAFVAVSYTQLNRVRRRLFGLVKQKGFSCPTYVSSKAFVWRTAQIGENCMIFENNVLQHGVQIGNGVTLWSGNHIGHRSEIGDYCYLSSHVVVSGFCRIGESSFLGVNSCLADHVTLEKDCVVGAGAVVLKSAGERSVLVGNPAKPLEKNSFEAFGVVGE